MDPADTPSALAYLCLLNLGDMIAHVHDRRVQRLAGRELGANNCQRSLWPIAALRLVDDNVQSLAAVPADDPNNVRGLEEREPT